MQIPREKVDILEIPQRKDVPAVPQVLQPCSDDEQERKIPESDKNTVAALQPEMDNPQSSEAEHPEALPGKQTESEVDGILKEPTESVELPQSEVL